MASASEGYHEPPETLTPKTRETHRALVSLQEELEAVDWYRQRADACRDDELRGILLHNMGEEVEHASMLLEWLRRNEQRFDKELRERLFSDADTPETVSNGSHEGTTSPEGEPAGPNRLTVGSLKSKS
jgi:hypothetical protein